MNDIYLNMGAVPPARLEEMMESLERRAATAQQQAALAAYLSDIDFPAGSRVIDVGCGTGPQARTLARRPGVASVAGFDQTPAFVARARALAAGIENLTFELADAAALPVGSASADVVVLHTLLTHVPDPAAVIAEAHRVLRPAGSLAVYDGDFSTMSVATAGADPLQACIEAFLEFQVNDRWLVRRLPEMLRAGGFVPGPARSHGHLETDEPVLTLGWTLRGADFLAEAGRIPPDRAEALKAAAHARAAAGRFYGFMNFVSIVARKAS